MRENQQRVSDHVKNPTVIAQNVKAQTALLGGLSLSDGWENGPGRGLKIASFTLNFR